MDFKGFSPDTFEQLIHALSLKVFGSGVNIFGNGPDGGREATFNGSVNYPTEAANSWQGYGVIQAKFKERIEGRDKDNQWAKSQLEQELQEWERSKKRTPKPDYFVFCINVELTSASGGGKDTLEQILNNYKEKLGFVDFAVWDVDKLRSLIDGHAETRQRFLAFFTQGDLLASIAKKLELESDVTDTLLSFIRNDLTSEKDAKVSQAGDRTGESMSLAKVFIDLPSSVDKNIPQENTSKLESLPELLEAGACNLDSESLESRDSPQYCSQYVFIGGPGSGKSTIGQFLSQIYRASILDRSSTSKAGPIKKAINEIKKRCKELNFNWPKTPRYPFRIDLNQFAKALSDSTNATGANTLSKYLRKKISEDEDISHRNLLNWFENFPCLIVFDGLDEVPASSNREQVIGQIQRFLNDIRAKNADVMIIASSRPDGYRGEFEDQGVVHKYLLPLNKDQALNCAKSYALAKYADNPSKVTEQKQKVEEALKNPLVEKLMQSPLQITFMVTVLDAHGTTSESRWKLFDDYYRTIFTRERQKAVRPFDRVLKERNQEIDVLHHEVGFILQHRAETEQTSAELPIAEFRSMVTNVLIKSGLEDEELGLELEEIIGAANERLVFLVSKRPEYLSFDVRSLQEYMAAMAITNAAPQKVIERLRKIAISDYWRNTLLFAIGRFFNDPHFFHERERIRTLCLDLNKDSHNDILTIKPGSILALEILESGTVGNTPAFIKGLTAIALELLDLQPNELNYSERLSNVYSEKVEREFKQEIELRIGQRDAFKAMSSWLLLAYLRSKDINWITDLYRDNWPSNRQCEKDILELYLTLKVITGAERNKIAQIYFSEHPIEVIKNRVFNELNTSYEKGDLLEQVRLLVTGICKTIDIGDSLGEDGNHGILNSGLTLSITSITTKENSLDIPLIREIITQSNKVDSRWNAVLTAYEFIIEPTMIKLEKATDDLKENEILINDIDSFMIFPWVLNYKIKEPNIDWKNSEFSSIENSEISLTRWLEIEDKLIKSNLSLKELSDLDGVNILQVLGAKSGVQYPAKIDNFNHLLESLPNKNHSERLIRAILFYCACTAEKEDFSKINEEVILTLLNKFEGSLFLIHVPNISENTLNTEKKIDSWSQILESICSRLKTYHVGRHNLNSNTFDFNGFIKLNFQKYPGLLKLLSHVIAAGGFVNIEKEFINTLERINSDSLYKLIIEIYSSTPRSNLTPKITKITNTISLNEKWLLLSFFENQYKNQSKWGSYIITFIDQLNKNEWKIKGKAQKILKEIISALPSNLDETDVPKITSIIQ